MSRWMQEYVFNRFMGQQPRGTETVLSRSTCRMGRGQLAAGHLEQYHRGVLRGELTARALARPRGSCEGGGLTLLPRLLRTLGRGSAMPVETDAVALVMLPSTSLSAARHSSDDRAHGRAPRHRDPGRRRMHELWLQPPTPEDLSFSAPWRITWRNAFLALDRTLKFLGRARGSRCVLVRQAAE